MDETTIAFEPPHARAAATRSGTLPDRISVRDYTRAVEIGAFRTERGVTQRIRFNIVLEVAPHGAAEDDDVDKVISYDTITDAIEAELAAERVNLLETLAERVAERCLADARALRVFVRLEKLDRIPGALGVEIARSRPLEAEPVSGGGHRAAAVIYLPGDLLAGAEGDAWLAAAVWARPVVICVGSAVPARPATSEAARRVGLLGMEQAAWTASERTPGFAVHGSRTELDWAAKTGRSSLWAPTKMVMDAKARPEADASRPDLLAAWLAREIGAARLVMAGEGAVPEGAIHVATPAALGALEQE